MATAAEHRAEIDRINGEVATQAAKIAQLSTILDGKAGGGGGGSGIVNVEIINNTTYSYMYYDQQGILQESTESKTIQPLNGVVSKPIVLSIFTATGDCYILSNFTYIFTSDGTITITRSSGGSN